MSEAPTHISHNKSSAATEMEVREELSLPVELILSLTNGIWWWTFQDPNGEDEIAVGSHQERTNILPVYMASGLDNTPHKNHDQLTCVE